MFNNMLLHLFRLTSLLRLL